MEDLQKIKTELAELKGMLTSLLNLNKPFVSKYNFYEWLSFWSEIYKRPYIADKTFKAIQRDIDVYIKPYIPDKNLSELTSDELELCLNNILYSRTKRNVYNILNGSLRKAYDLGHIVKDIMRAVTRVNHISKEDEPLNNEEKKLLKRITRKSKYQLCIMLYCETGCRFSEMFSIKMSDINFKEKTLHIPGTKTDGSDRIIPLFDSAAEIINSLPKAEEGRLFNFRDSALKSYFRRLKERYKFRFSIKSLRNTFAAKCSELGIQENTIQKWLGHTNPRTTRRYIKVMSEFELLEVKKFNKGKK